MRFSFSSDGTIPRFAADLKTRAQSVSDALRRYDREYLRPTIRERFASEGPGWEPRKDASEDAAAARVRERTERAVRRKLRGDVRRAVKREAAGTGRATSVERRYEVLKEFERRVRGGSAILSVLGDQRLSSSLGKLEERAGRAQEKASGRILGRLASSISSKVTRGQLIVESKVAWSGVHNDGGTAGHGADIPARPFLYLDDKDHDVLRAMLEEHLAQ